MQLLTCGSPKYRSSGSTLVREIFRPRLLAAALVFILSSACAGPQPTDVRPADVTAATVAVSSMAVAAQSTVAPSRQSSSLVTNSGIDLGASANPPFQEQGAEPDLQPFQTQKGTRVLVPSTWRAQSPVSISQKVCAGDRCVTIDETLQLFISAGGANALGVMSMALPADASIDVSSLLPGAIRGSISALSAAGANPDIVEAPAPVNVANATRSLQARARIVDPTSGETETVTVLAAARDREIDALLIGVSDVYLRDHQAFLERIRSSFGLAGAVQ